MKHVGVLGGGLMGSGIATVSLPHARVTVKEIDPAAAERCERTIRAALDQHVRSGALESARRDALLPSLADDHLVQRRVTH